MRFVHFVAAFVLLFDLAFRFWEKNGPMSSIVSGFKFISEQEE